MNSDPTTEAIERARVKDAFFEQIGGLEPASLPLTDLDNEIHPLFARANFKWRKGESVELTEFAETRYNAILPSLRLASLLLTEPAFLSKSPLDRIANGFRTIDAEANGLPGGHLGATNFLTQRQLWERDGSKADWQTDPDIMETLTTTGSHDGNTMTRDRAVHKGQKRIRLTGSFLSCFVDNAPSATPAWHLNTYVALTSLLLHETAHALHFRLYGPHRTCEPRFSFSNIIYELDWETEAWLYGGHQRHTYTRNQLEAFTQGGQNAQGVNDLPFTPVVHTRLREWGMKEDERGWLILPRFLVTKESVKQSFACPVLTAKVVQMWFLKSTRSAFARTGGLRLSKRRQRGQC